MDQLDGHASQQGFSRGGAKSRRGRSEGQRRAEPLAAGVDEMGGDLVQESVSGDDALREQGLEP